MDEIVHIWELHFPKLEIREGWRFPLREQRCLLPTVAALGSGWAQFTHQVEVQEPLSTPYRVSRHGFWS